MNPIIVTAGIIIIDKKILITQRKNDKTPRANKWEFPGGKLEKGETLKACLSRELNEELAVTIDTPEAFITVQYPYPDKTIRLHAFIIRSYTGSLQLNCHQRMQWVTIDNLPDVDLSEADKIIAGELLKNPKKILRVI